VGESQEHRRGSGRTCYIPPCSSQFWGHIGFLNHVQTTHPELLQCHQCSEKYSSLWWVERHAYTEDHAAFICPSEGCVSTFSRIDVFKRHLIGHREDVKRFSCNYCKKYRGKNGFKRKDHLTQHLRNYHHIGEVSKTKVFNGNSCPHKDCESYREGAFFNDGSKCDYFRNHAFKRSPDYITHMRKVHNESPFPCSVSGCDKVNGKGYFRRRDLAKHRQKKHGEFLEGMDVAKMSLDSLDLEGCSEGRKNGALVHNFIPISLSSFLAVIKQQKHLSKSLKTKNISFISLCPSRFPSPTRYVI
jgi:hypothetical protein